METYYADRDAEFSAEQVEYYEEWKNHGAPEEVVEEAPATTDDE